LVDFTLGSILSYAGLIFLWIAVIWNYLDERKRKKEGTFKYIEKDPKWKQTYIWQVFFRRSFYRPCASTFPYLIFVFPSSIMMLILSSVLLDITINGKAVKLEEMKKISGIVTEIHEGKGKNSYDYIKLKDDNGNEEKYRIYYFHNKKETQEFKEKTNDKNVTIWYQDMWFFKSYKEINELKLNTKFITINGEIRFKYNYKKRLEINNNIFPDLLWWINYSLVGWLWIWLLNKKELPIHRLNRRKFYKKNKLKDEK